jgi:hypothetical protein
MKLYFLTLGFLVIVQASAQTKIDTDRPDQTESAVLVPKKYFQGEFGFNRENLQKDTHNIVHPTFLLKYGLNKRIEFRVESEFSTQYLLQNEKGTTALQPVEIGTKISLLEEKGLRPKTSLIVHLGLPFMATHPDGNQELFPSFRFTLQNTLTEKIGLGYNVGSEWNGYENKAIWLYTFSPNFTIGERWYSYIEIFGFREEGWQHAIDGGVAYYLSNDVKLDLSAGVGLKDNPLRNYVALGFSFRVPISSKYRLSNSK